jgi:uridylate kinase
MKVVFSIGGSILAPSGIDAEYIAGVALMLRNLSAKHHLAVVVGGGRPARERIAQARAKGASWAECDHVGIMATRENARALIAALGREANRTVPETIYEAASIFGKRIVVMGGTEPGHSTDAVAALLADWVGADLFINASNVDAVYNKNPKKFPDARPLDNVRIDDLMALLSGEGFNAGEYPLLDPTALKVIKRSNLKTLVLSGKELDNMSAAAEGRPFKGTTVTQ